MRGRPRLADYTWLTAPVFSADGTVVHGGGVTTGPGLFFLGMITEAAFPDARSRAGASGT